MVEPPVAAKDVTGTTTFGVDDTGNHAFFGFKTGGGPADFIANYKVLGLLINYLQAIANEAQQTRLTLDPNASDLEARQTRSNPVTQAALEPDIGGTSAALVCTTEDGTRVEAQLDFDLLQGLLERLPKILAEMKRRQAAHRGGH
jgi:hypothetical protein